MRLDDRTLRAIGQDLERLGVYDLVLELEGEKCVVRALADSADSPEPSPPSRALKSWWKQLRNTEPDPPSDAAPTAVKKTYLSDDIDRLVTEGKSRRRNQQAEPKNQERPDPHSLAEIFRVLGVYCDTAGLQLVSVSKRGERLKYDYLTESAERQVEERVFSDLHDFVDAMVSKRKESVGD